MCSILGYIDNKKEINYEKLLEMNQVLKHRGPDDEGVICLSMFGSTYKNVGIAHNRLSIRDLTKDGHQPMISKNGDIIICFNGEIYNADEFRADLCKLGVEFKSTSDTEVLLYMYEKFGLYETLKKIDGMYAICIVDKRYDEIYLIRDKVGEKPLYYYKNENLFMWASEYKAFYMHPGFKAVLDEENLTEYLMFRYVCGGKTLLKGVCNIEPGTYIRIKKDKIEFNDYWSFSNKTIYRDNNVIEDIFIDKLHKAFSTRLISDVEVGIQLSGGVDSSCLVEYISRSQKTKVFGIIFDNENYSEKKYMDYVISRCNVEPFLYLLSEDVFLDTWLKTTYYFEAPMNHEGTLGLFHLNRQASKKLKVMLCGEGADETMGGYSRFYEILKYIEDNGNSDKDNAYIKFIRLSQYVKDYDVLDMYHEAKIEDVILKRKKIFTNTNGNGIRKYMNYETMTYCQDLLMRADKISMANAIEQRVPYLSSDLLEFENSIPDEYFVSSTRKGYIKNTKVLLKDYCSKIFGDDFTYREKMGFGFSIDEFLLKKSVRIFIEKCILPGIMKRGILNYETIFRIYNKKKEGKMNYGLGNGSATNVLWTALSFELWAQMYLDANPNKLFRGVFDESNCGTHA